MHELPTRHALTADLLVMAMLGCAVHERAAGDAHESSSSSNSSSLSSSSRLLRDREEPPTPLPRLPLEAACPFLFIALYLQHARARSHRPARARRRANAAWSRERLMRYGAWTMHARHAEGCMGPPSTRA